MEDSVYRKLKYQTSKLYDLCNKIWPTEFQQVYQSDPTDFREWLNSKTGLNFDHRMKKHEAIEAWLNAIEKIIKR